MISPCCGRKYHLDCIQSMASASGRHHFKCPACSVKDIFLEAAIAIGIYVPEQDAAWEKDSFYDFESQGTYSVMQEFHISMNVFYSKQMLPILYHIPTFRSSIPTM